MPLAYDEHTFEQLSCLNTTHSHKTRLGFLCISSNLPSFTHRKSSSGNFLICLFVHSSVCQHAFLSIFIYRLSVSSVSVCLSVCVRLSVCSPICLFVCLSVCLSVRLSVCVPPTSCLPPFNISICQTVLDCLPVCLSTLY